MRKLGYAALGIAGAAFISRYILSFDWLLIAAGIALMLSLAGLPARGNTRIRIVILTLSLSAGFILNFAYTAFFVSPYWELHEQSRTMSATVTDYPVAREPRGYRADVSLQMDGRPPIGARLYYYEEIKLEPGDVIRFDGKFYRTDINDAGERYDILPSQGIFLSVSVTGSITVTDTHNNSLRYFPKQIAYRICEKIDEIYPPDVSHFLKAFLAGNRNNLNEDKALYASLTASGLIHIIAISGMHISFLMGFLAILIRNKRLFALYGIPVLVLFMAMTGFTPAVTRAGIMQIFLICAPLFKRDSDSITSLSAAVLLLLGVNPYACASIGLQMSFASTLGIVLFASRMNNSVTDYFHGKSFYRKKAPRAVINYISSSLSTTLGAMALTLPLSVIHFGYISLVAPLTNLLTIGIVSLTFPLGLTAVALGFIHISAGSAAAFPVVWAVRYIKTIAQIFSALPYSIAYSSSAHILFWLAYVYILFITMPLLKARLRQYIYPVCISIIALLAVIFVSLTLPANAENTLTVLDVGQGQSVVAHFDGHTMVVDCGSISTNKAGEITHEFLQSSECLSIDVLAVTHFHEDHVNGVEFLLSRIDISLLIVPDPENSFIAGDIIEMARRKGTEILYVTQAMSLTLGDTQVFIYPPMGSGDENEQGLSVLTMGKKKVLITGDMDASVERALLRYADLPMLDVLVIGHHGSRMSTSEELLTALSPNVAVISVGKNSFGHPATDTLERLAAFGVMVYRTDEMGHVTVR